jgi:four helix bundle protein
MERRTQYFEKPEVWQLAVGLVKAVYLQAAGLPRSETHCLGDQLRRSAVSVPLNIAEGRASDSDAEFGRFLGISLKSLIEVKAAARLCEELELLGTARLESLYAPCGRLEAKPRTFRKKLSRGKTKQ